MYKETALFCSLNKHPEPPSGARIQRLNLIFSPPGCHSNGNRKYHRQTQRKEAGCCCLCWKLRNWNCLRIKTSVSFAGTLVSEHGLLPWASLLEKPRTRLPLFASSWYQRTTEKLPVGSFAQSSKHFKSTFSPEHLQALNLVR